MTSGTIQGSFLGSLLFTICIESLLNSINKPTSTNADDFKFITKLFTIFSYESVTQYIVCVIGLWKWKCHYLSRNFWSFTSGCTIHTVNYNSGNYTLINRNSCDNIGIVRSYEEKFRGAYSFNCTESSPAYLTMYSTYMQDYDINLKLYTAVLTAS